MFLDNLTRPAPARVTDNWNGLMSFLTVGATFCLANQHNLLGLMKYDTLAHTVVFAGLNEIVREGANAIGRTVATKKNPWAGFMIGTALGVTALTTSFSKIEKQVFPILHTSHVITDSFMETAEELIQIPMRAGAKYRQSLDNK